MGTQTLRDLRTQAGLRIIDVCVAFDTSESRVRDWEKGRSSPRLDRVIPLAKLFGVGVVEVLDAIAQTKEGASV